MKDKLKIPKDSFEDLEDLEVPPNSGRRRPLSALFQEIGTNLTEILRSEFRLARAEVSQDVRQFAKASLFLIVSAIFALYAFGFILLSVMYALEETVPAWASALIVGGGVGILAAITLFIGRNRMKLASLTPDKTIQSLQENVTWLKKQTK